MRHIQSHHLVHSIKKLVGYSMICCMGLVLLFGVVGALPAYAATNSQLHAHCCVSSGESGGGGFHGGGEGSGGSEFNGSSGRSGGSNFSGGDEESGGSSNNTRPNNNFFYIPPINSGRSQSGSGGDGGWLGWLAPGITVLVIVAIIWYINNVNSKRRR
jgi:hypothetical protein